MGIDTSKVQKKLQQMKQDSNGGGGFDNVWKPEPGTQTIRIVPYRFNKDYPFNELYFHYDIPGPSYVSPKSYGDPDPIVEFAEELKDKGGKENYKLANKLEPSLRTFAPVIVRGQKNEGVRFWGFGKNIYKRLLNLLANDSWGDFTDLQNGYDMELKYVPADEADGQFPETHLEPLPDKKPIVDDPNRAKELIKSQPPIDEVFQAPDYETLQEQLDDYLNPEDEEENESVTTKKSQSNSDSSSSVDVDEVTDEFSDIFEED